MSALPTQETRSIPLAVWAPHAGRVEAVLTDGSRVPLTPLAELRAAEAAELPEHALPEDFWRDPDLTGVFAVRLPVGTDFLLSVDGRDPRPHPRSLWQPHGVHGPSRVFDLQAHAWTDGDWPGIDPLGKVFYELHVGTFTEEGTLDAAIERLPHLAGLGVDVVELMPLAAFAGERGWGYDGVDLYAVHEPYGGPAALQRFVDAAHRAGIGVCLDVVYNHFGPAGNYLSEFGPYLTGKHVTPWGQAVNLDDDNASGVRSYIIDNALMWIRDFHVDALRLDAVHALYDDSELHLLAELAESVHALGAELGRPATVTAESDLNDASMVAARPDGLGLDAQWADDVHHAVHSYLTGETFGYYSDFGAPETLAKALTRVFVHDGTFSTFRGREWGRPVGDDVDRRRFIVHTQNHDQVGNRGLGDRPDQRLHPGVVAASAAVLLLGPHTPMLFMGQEWSTKRPFLFFTDHDEELGELIRQGRRSEFADHGWSEIYGNDLQVPDPQALDTFSASQLDWSEPERAEHAHMLTWYRQLIALRHELLTEGRLPVTCSYDAGWFRLDHGPLTVVFTRGDGTTEFADDRALEMAYGDVEATEGTVRLGENSVAILRTPPASV